jgi:hypothetical protein
MATQLNKLIDRHKAACPSLEGLRFGLEWTPELVDFTNFAASNSRAIPVLPGNRGKERDEAVAKETTPFELGEEDVGADDDRRGDRDERDRERNRREGRGNDRSRDRDWRDSRREEPREREVLRDDRDDSGGRSLSDILGRNRDRDRDDDRDRGGRGRRDDRDRDRGRGGNRYSGRSGSRGRTW